MKSKFFVNLGMIFPLLLATVVTSEALEGNKPFNVTVTGKGAPIFFIPGYGCSGEVWDGAVKNLSRNYECHVFTLAGFAGVPPVESPILPKITKEIFSYIEEKKLDRPIIIGHSLGGFIGLSIAAEHPQAIRKLIIVDALPFFAAVMNPAITPDSLRMDAEQSGAMFAAMSDSGFQAYIRSAVSMMVSSPADIERILGWCARSDKYTYGHEFVEFFKTDLRKHVSAINCPTLLMVAKGFGKEATLKAWNDQYAALQHKQIDYNEHALHFIMLDDPAWFMDRVNSFLAN